jgi:hypothetical protein
MIRLVELAQIGDSASKGPFENCKLNYLFKVKIQLAYFSSHGRYATTKS